jgi:thiamine-monophosphate kinase
MILILPPNLNLSKYFKPLAASSFAALNLSEDIAKIKLAKGKELVVSKDMIVEDVHFLRKDGGYKIASKLLRANLSDIAASGAKPLYYMLGFSKNVFMDENFIKDFALGLKDTQKEFKISLIGGDTVRSDKALFFSMTIFGSITKNKILLRSKAKDKDLIFVSGDIGDAYLGLNLSLDKLKYHSKYQDYLLNRHYFPTPRINLARNLIKNNLSCSAIDISDGLLADLNHICKTSKLEAIIYKDKIPFSLAAKEILAINQKIDFRDLISGGDDYELIFTAKAKNLELIKAVAKKSNTKITCIGYFKKTNDCNQKNHLVRLYDGQEKEIDILKYGYQH